MKKIFIDINPILKKRLTGIGIYTFHLLKELMKVQGDKCQLSFVYNKRIISHLKQYEDIFNGEINNIMKRSVSYDIDPDKEMGRVFSKISNVLIYSKIKDSGCDVFHGPSFKIPILPKTIKKIVTIHDLAFLHYPDIESDYARNRLTQTVKESVEIADRIIAVSKATKDDIIKFYDVNEQKISVVYEGVDQEVKYIGETEKNLFRKENNLPESFILFVGATNKRKNLLTLVKALGILKNKDVKLLIVGKEGNQHAEIMEAINKAGIEERVRFFGYCSNEDLAKLYVCARAFVFPSIYEGFGLPVLEAMRYGVPVITANNSSLKELFIEAAVLVDAMNEKELAKAIDKVVENTEFADSLRQKGKDLSQKFNWEKMAKETLDIYLGSDLRK